MVEATTASTIPPKIITRKIKKIGLPPEPLLLTVFGTGVGVGAGVGLGGSGVGVATTATGVVKTLV